MGRARSNRHCTSIGPTGVGAILDPTVAIYGRARVGHDFDVVAELRDVAVGVGNEREVGQAVGLAGAKVERREVANVGSGCAPDASLRGTHASRLHVELSRGGLALPLIVACLVDARQWRRVGCGRDRGDDHVFGAGVVCLADGDFLVEVVDNACRLSLHQAEIRDIRSRPVEHAAFADQSTARLPIRRLVGGPLGLCHARCAGVGAEVTLLRARGASRIARLNSRPSSKVEPIQGYNTVDI